MIKIAGYKGGISREASYVKEIQAATTIHAAETVIGGEIDVHAFNTLAVFVDYTNGDETSVDIIPKFLNEAGGDEHPLCSWSSAAGVKTVTADKFQLTASGKHYVTLDVRGLNFVKLYEDATGGTPTGTLQCGYTLSNN